MNTSPLCLRTARLVAIFAVMFCALPLRAGEAEGSALAQWRRFSAQAQSAQFHFEQEVISPGAGKSVRVRKSSGTFELSRPGRFRFAYSRPYEQTLTADGRYLWIYDKDLNQVTRRSLSDLGESGLAMTLLTESNEAIERLFVIAALPSDEGLDWLQALPRSETVPLKEVRMAFKDALPQIIDITDALGVRSRITLSAAKLNVVFAPAHFRFQVPAGADFIKQ